MQSVSGVPRSAQVALDLLIVFMMRYLILRYPVHEISRTYESYLMRPPGKRSQNDATDLSTSSWSSDKRC